MPNSSAPDSGVTNAVHTGQPNSGLSRITEAGTCITSAKGAMTVNSTRSGRG